MKTRFAPSPTGPFHIGGLRTALLVFILAEQNKGEAILRLEDTDTQRSTQAYEEDITHCLDWAGLNFPQPYIKQSQRLFRYKDVVQKLLDKGLAYRCYMTVDELNTYRQDIRAKNKAMQGMKIAEKYDNRYRPDNWPQGIPKDIIKKNPTPVIRIIMPTEGTTQWNDMGKGGISIPNSQLDDLIIARADMSPTYNFCVVVDDLDMNITHVIRGDDHISNTPKQIQIAKILAKLDDFVDSKIEYCHIPLMFNPDGTKISKSALADPKNQEKVKNGQIVPAALADYKKMGILPQALTNYLLLISSQKTAQSIGSEQFSLSQFIDNFLFKDLSKTAAQFDLGKLKEINFNYIQQMSCDEFFKHIQNHYLNFSFHGQNYNLEKINFSAIFTEVQKRSKTIDQAVGIVIQTLETQDIFSKNNNDFYNSLVMCGDHERFKALMSDNALHNGVKFGDLAKKIRLELNINSGLPLFEIFQAIAHTKPLQNKISP